MTTEEMEIDPPSPLDPPSPPSAQLLQEMNSSLSPAKMELPPVLPMVPADDLETHRHFMRAALDMADTALKTDEVPVGCVFVHNNQIIGRGKNDTNRSLCVCCPSLLTAPLPRPWTTNDVSRELAMLSL